MYRGINIILAFMLISISSYGQNVNTLLNELVKSKEDTNKVLLLIRIGNEYENTSLDSAMFYYTACDKLSESLKYDVGILKYISNYTAVLNFKNKYEESLKMNLNAVELATKIKNQKQLAIAYGNVGASYYGMRIYDKSIDYFLKSSLILETLNDKAHLTVLYRNMAGIYSEMQRESSLGYVYGLKSLALSRALQDTSSIEAGLVNTAGILMDLKKLDSANVLLRQAFDLCKKTNDKYSMVSVLSNLDYIEMKTGDYSSLKENTDVLSKLSTELKDKEGIAYSLYYYGKYYFQLKQFQLAKSYIEKELPIAKEQKLNKVLSKCYLFLSDINLALGNLPEYEKNRLLNDSLDDVMLSDQIQTNIQNFEAKYSLAKKQSEINSLTKEKQIEHLKLRQRYILNWLLVGIVFIILLVSFLYYRNNQQKGKLLFADAELKQQQINKLETEKQLLATQSVLQGQEEERKRLAKDLHDGLGSILSSAKYSFSNMKNNLIISPENALAFDRSIAILDKSIQELRMIAHNMMPEALVKFGLDTALKDFCNSINQNSSLKVNYQSFELTDETISQNKSSAIYRIVQELVNNILKHANAKTALVQLLKKETTLSITVEDDGNGFDVNRLKNSTGIGYLNLQNRVTYLNGTMDVQSAIGKGTSVNIELLNISND